MFFYYDLNNKGVLDFEKKHHVLIGQNGSGKSSLLRSYAKESIERGFTTIGVAPFVYDKFNDIRSRKFTYTGGRHGKNIINKAISRLFKKIATGEVKLLSSVGATLRYMGFSDTIGVSIDIRRRDNLDSVVELNSDEKYEIKHLLNEFIHLSRDRVHWIHFKKYEFTNFVNDSMFRLIKHEEILKRHGVVGSINYYLMKDGVEIPITDASSGELTLISTIISISTSIDDKTVILIDEPETSLHPQWQKEYFKKLLDLFYYWQPRIIIATHSPIILSGIEADELFDQVEIYKIDTREKIKINKPEHGIEEVLWGQFNLITPQSNFLSEKVVQLLNDLIEKKIDIQLFNDEINRYKKSSYDKNQMDALEDAIEIATKIELKKGK